MAAQSAGQGAGERAHTDTEGVCRVYFNSSFTDSSDKKKSWEDNIDRFSVRVTQKSQKDIEEAVYQYA